MKYLYHLLPALMFMLLIGGLASAFRPAAPLKKPNIILIMADDMGYECLSSYGSASYSTPNLDKLAQNGVRFTHAYSQPLCTPSRVQIMTGKYNYRNYSSFGFLDPREKTFGNLFRNAGYNTCIAGKWQLNGISGEKRPGWNDLNRPHHFGFDEYCLWQVNKGRNVGERFANPLLVQNGRELPRQANAYGPDIMSRFVLDFIDRKRDKPFFVYYPMALVHDPFVPTPDSRDWDDPAGRYRQDPKYFKDMVVYTDKIVGQIMEKLRQTGQEDNTLILFTGDNGTNVNITSRMKDGRLIKGDKGQMTDGGTRVPLIAYWKGKALKGKVSADLVDFSDFMPTLADAAGISIPEDQVVDGQSFLPQVLGKPATPKQYIYMYYKPEWGKFKNGAFVRNHRYKLYHDGRFFDLQNDVLEKHPIDLKAAKGTVLATAKMFQKVLDQKPHGEL